MKRSQKLLLVSSLVFLGMSFTLNLAFLSKAVAGKMPLRSGRELKLIYQVFRAVQDRFVEEDKAKDRTNLIHSGIEGMLTALDDPYSRFMRPVAYKDMRTESKGEFGGLGIVIGMRDGHITVISPMSGTPAYKAGVQAGDIIVKVDDEPVDELSLNQVVELLRGVVDTSVEVTFFRPSLRKLLPIKITRAKISLPGVRSAFLEGGIGYAYAPGFNEKTAQDLEARIEEWEPKGLNGFVLDLRSNPGGLLDAAVAVSRLFLGPGTIVSVKDRRGRKMEYKSFHQKYKPWPLVVLIDEGSASASEIVAGAIRDNHRGLLLGNKSFGKGSVQTVLPLSDGSAMALTTAYYYMPSGELIHKKGVHPHIKVSLKPLTTEQLIDLRNLRSRLVDDPTLDAEAEDNDPNRVYEKLAPLDPQLQAAVELLRGSQMLSEEDIPGSGASTAPGK